MCLLLIPPPYVSLRQIPFPEVCFTFYCHFTWRSHRKRPICFSWVTCDPSRRTEVYPALVIVVRLTCDYRKDETHLMFHVGTIIDRPLNDGSIPDRSVGS